MRGGAIAAGLGICAALGWAQTPAPVAPASPPVAFSPQVWDIDWSRVKDPGNPQDWTDRFHWIPLDASGRSVLSVTGQIRERGEYQDHPGFGAQPPDNGYLLQRYQLSGDLHVGERFRSFVQLESSLIEGRDGGPRPGIDRDKLDVNQGFVDVTAWRSGENRWMFRAGRQLVSLGSTRLVAIGAGLNVEQPFDGFRAQLRAGKWSADGIALRPVLIGAGVLDNAPNSAEELWGLYASREILAWKSNADLYYLGFDHRQARYTQGSGREQRETLGGRVWSHRVTWDYDFEFTGQFGRFGAGGIRAWGAGYHAGYTFAGVRFAPHPELDGGVLSGDHNPRDERLGTFNPLFPNGNYLSQSILLGPLNLVIVRPTLKLSLTKKASSNTNAEFLWRQAKQDGVYNIVGILTHPANGSQASFIGSQIQEELDYVFNRHWSGAITYEHFFAGAFLKQSPPGKSVNYLAPQLMWNF
jgi:hypothetical protein